MTHPILSLILFFCLSVGYNISSVAAQMMKESGAMPPTGLTLADAIAQALARNRDLAVARFGVEVNRGKLQQSRLYPFNPELFLDGDIGRGTLRDNGSERSLAGRTDRALPGLGGPRAAGPADPRGRV